MFILSQMVSPLFKTNIYPLLHSEQIFLSLKTLQLATVVRRQELFFKK